MLITAVIASDYIVKYTVDSTAIPDVQIGDFKVSFVSKMEAMRLYKNRNVEKIYRNTIKHVAEVQSMPTWGIDRIDDLGLDKLYNYPSSAGEGTTAYIVDTGINTNHTDFGNRATFGFDATNEGFFDGHGHGSHVAGTVSGLLYGVAKKAEVVAVKVLGTDGYGDDAGIIKGLEFVVADAKLRRTKATINMSIGGELSQVLDDAVNAVVKQGIVVIVAAGNENQNACNSSPAAAKEAITVGATDSRDRKAGFSNWGPCVDINGPGVNIKSVWKGTTTGTNTISGYLLFI